MAGSKGESVSKTRHKYIKRKEIEPSSSSRSGDSLEACAIEWMACCAYLYGEELLQSATTSHYHKK